MRYGESHHTTNKQVCFHATIKLYSIDFNLFMDSITKSTKKIDLTAKSNT